MKSSTIQFVQDIGHPCPYLDGQESRNIYPHNVKLDNRLYSVLIQNGFRRSGDYAYRPNCAACNACVPVRINVAQFKPNRSQKRCIKRNQQITTHMKIGQFDAEHFDLYCDYVAIRHAGGGMDNPSKENYENFLLSSWSETLFIEFRNNRELVAVAVTDMVKDGLSAFYTFYAPEMAKHSLGTLAILRQIEIAKQFGFSSLYLGYWIEQCQKMRYKNSFSAVEAYQDQQWQPLT